MTGVHAASAVAPVVLLPAANRQLSMIPGVEVSPMKDENVQEPPITPEEIRPANPGLGKRFFVVLAIGFIFLLLAAANPAPIKAAWAEFERIIQLKSDPLPASPAKLSGHEIEGLSSMAPQQQAELLMERAINHYEGAIELIEKNVSGWYGQLEVEKDPLAHLLNTAIHAHDLPGRAHPLELPPAADNLP